MALLIEFTEIRLAVEPVAAALAAASAGADEKAAIRAAIVRMQAADRGEDDPLESDIAFHVAVLRGSRTDSMRSSPNSSPPRFDSAFA